MPRQKGSGNGSIYYDKDKNKWIVKHYKYDIITNSEKQVKKAFSSEAEAIIFLEQSKTYMANRDSNENIVFFLYARKFNRSKIK